MPEGASRDVARAGMRLRRRLLLALFLSSVLPLLVLAYVVHRYVAPALASGAAAPGAAVEALLLLTVVGIAAGARMIWSLVQTVAGMADLVAKTPRFRELESRNHQIGSLMSTFSRMFETIEQQATEINSFATRLDATCRELEQTNARLRETSFKDEVTGLYNRRFLSVRLEEEISRHRRFNHPVSVALLDLDDFKAVNDDFGHATGDGTLREVAAILMRHSRGINVVSRYGGDEFAVLLVETPRDGARLYADRICQVMARHRFSHGRTITASVGVAGLPDDDAASGEQLVKLADEALYAAKRSGKNRVATLPSEKRPPWTAETS